MHLKPSHYGGTVSDGQDAAAAYIAQQMAPSAVRPVEQAMKQLMSLVDEAEMLSEGASTRLEPLLGPETGGVLGKDTAPLG